MNVSVKHYLMMMMMNCFCGMVDRRKAFSPISSRDHCHRSLPSRISDTPRAGFEPASSFLIVVILSVCVRTLKQNNVWAVCLNASFILT